MVNVRIRPARSQQFVFCNILLSNTTRSKVVRDTRPNAVMPHDPYPYIDPTETCDLELVLAEPQIALGRNTWRLLSEQSVVIQMPVTSNVNLGEGKLPLTSLREERPRG
jgi:hypothetical protein